MQKKKTAYVSPNIAGILSLFDPALDWSADLSGDEYATALKEFLVVHQEGSKDPRKDDDIETDVLEGIRKEFLKVRKNKDLEYSVKKTKIKGNKFFDKDAPKNPRHENPDISQIFNTENIKPTDIDPESQTDQSSALVPKRLDGIADSVESIATLLRRQLGLQQKQQRDAQVKQDQIDKQDREDDLEKKPDDKKKSLIPDAIKKPALNFFEKIKKFFLNIVIGSVVLKLFNWVKDPANAEKITKFKDFLVDNAGWILGSLATIALLPTILTVVSVVKGILAGLALLGPLLPALPWILGGILVGAVAWWIGKKVTNKLQEAISGGGEFSNLDKLAKEDLEKHGLTRMRNIGAGEHSAELVGDDGKPIWVNMYGEDSLTGREALPGEMSNYREKLTIGNDLHEAYIEKTMGKEKLNTYKAAAERYNKAIFERKDPLKEQMGKEIRAMKESIPKTGFSSSGLGVPQHTKEEKALMKKKEAEIRLKYDELVKKEFPEYYSNKATINKESSSATVNKESSSDSSATIDKNVKPNTNVPGPSNKNKGGQTLVIPGGGGGQTQSGGGGGGDSQSSTVVPKISSKDLQNKQTVAVQAQYNKVAVD